jgi:hypothetical protein
MMGLIQPKPTCEFLSLFEFIFLLVLFLFVGFRSSKKYQILMNER